MNRDVSLGNSIMLMDISRGHFLFILCTLYYVEMDLHLALPPNVDNIDIDRVYYIHVHITIDITTIASMATI